MYQKILVPMDGSENAECVIEHVKTIAAGCKAAEVILLRVIEPFPSYVMSLRMTDTFVQQAQDAVKADAIEFLNKVVDKMKNEGLSVSTAVLEGNPAVTILDYAAKNGVDLIIMATHGRTGVARFALGSVADKVVRGSSAPVMVVAPAGCRVTL